VTPSVSATQPMVSAQPMGMNLVVFLSGTPNHNTQSTPWASNHFSFGMPDMFSPLPSSVLLSYANPSFGFGHMMPPYSSFLFGGGHIPQSIPIVGVWNPPSSGPNHSFTFPGFSAHIDDPSTSYISSIYPSFAMLVPTNSFSMENLPLTFGVSSRGSQFYNMGNPFHRVPSSGGNIYPHLSNPCHVAFSSQAASSVMMPLQPFINQFGGGYYHVGKGHGVYHNPFWPAISQKQSFPRPWSLMLQPTAAIHAGSTSPITASHIGIMSPTSIIHVGDLSPTSASHIGDLKPTYASHVGDLSPTFASYARGKQATAASHVGGTTLVIASHTRQTSTSVSHVGRLATSLCKSCWRSTTSLCKSCWENVTNHYKSRRIGCKPKLLCLLCK
jgi:hypothetical protein